MLIDRFVNDTGRTHFLLRKSNKRRYNEIEDEEKEELKSQIEEYKKSKFTLEKKVFEFASKVNDLIKDNQDHQKDSDRLRELYEEGVVDEDDFLIQK